MASFVQRADNLTMAQELLALPTSRDLLSGRVVRIWVDSQGGEFALLTGSTKQLDHNRLVHAIWIYASGNQMGLWIERVLSHGDIASEPSRG